MTRPRLLDLFGCEGGAAVGYHRAGWDVTGVDLDANRLKRYPFESFVADALVFEDTNVRQALVDRFTPGAANHGKGTKAEPGWFYGFHSDVWAAYVLAVLVADRHLGRAS